MDPFPSDNRSDRSSDPDVFLMLEFQKGNRASFETLMRKYYGRIFNFAYRFLDDRSLAEDAAQEVFVRIYKSAGSYRPSAKFSTWAYTIAKNICLNELRRSGRRTVSLDENMITPEGSLPRQVEDVDGPRPGENLSREETAQIVRAAIGELPDNQRMAVILRRYEGLSYADIGRTLGVSEKAVKSLLSRAREQLRVKLSGYIFL